MIVAQIQVVVEEMGGKQPDIECTLNLQMVKPADGFEIKYQFKSGVKTDVEDFQLNKRVR